MPELISEVEAENVCESCEMYGGFLDDKACARTGQLVLAETSVSIMSRFGLDGMTTDEHVRLGDRDLPKDEQVIVTKGRLEEMLEMNTAGYGVMALFCASQRQAHYAKVPDPDAAAEYVPVELYSREELANSIFEAV